MAAKAKTDPAKSTFPTGTATAPTGSIADIVGTDIVKIRHPVRGQDASGARVVQYQDWEADIVRGDFVTINSTSYAATKIHQFGHEGELITYKFVCGFKMQYRDQILWVSEGEIYTVIRAVRNKDDTTRWDHFVVDFKA